MNEFPLYLSVRGWVRSSYRLTHHNPLTHRSGRKRSGAGGMEDGRWERQSLPKILILYHFFINW